MAPDGHPTMPMYWEQTLRYRVGGIAEPGFLNWPSLSQDAGIDY